MCSKSRSHRSQLIEATTVGRRLAVDGHSAMEGRARLMPARLQTEKVNRRVRKWEPREETAPDAGLE